MLVVCGGSCLDVDHREKAMEVEDIVIHVGFGTGNMKLLEYPGDLMEKTAHPARDIHRRRTGESDSWRNFEKKNFVSKDKYGRIM